MTDALGLGGKETPAAKPEPSGKRGYPTKEEGEAALDYTMGQDTGNEAFMKGEAGRTYRSDAKFGKDVDQFYNIRRLTEDASPEDKGRMAEAFQRAEVASKRSAVAGLGYDPHKVSGDWVRSNLGGEYDAKTDRIRWMFTTPDNESALIHESVHRGFKLLRDQSAEAREIFNRTPINEEMFVRYIMATKMGDPENNPNHSGSVAQRGEALKLFEKYGSVSKDLARLEEIAAELKKEKRPGGPR